MRRWLLVTGVLLLAAFLALGLTQLGGEATLSEAPRATDAERVRLEGRDALSGQPLDLDDYRGRVVVINVWASWCPSCNEEAALFKELAERHPEVQLLGVDIFDTPEGARLLPPPRLGLAFTRALSLAGWVRRHWRPLRLASGGLLVLFGLLLASGLLGELTAWLARYTPFAV